MGATVPARPSVTCAHRDSEIELSEWVGEPEMTPVDTFRDNPIGNEPAPSATDHWLLRGG